MPRLSPEDRRAELLNATVAVMLDKGFAGATTRDVAARLGIGRGLIHHYFESWEFLQRAAFLAVEETARTDTRAIIGSMIGWERLATLLDILIAEPDDAHWRLYADAWDEAQRDPDLAKIVTETADWWRGELRTALAPLLHDRVSADDSAERLMALADGLSGQVLMTNARLSRRRAVALLNDAARMELARQTNTR